MTYEVKFRLTESTDLVPYRHISVNAVQGSNQWLYLGILWYTQDSVWSNGGLAALAFKRLNHTDVENCSDDGDWDVQYLGDWFRNGFHSVSLRLGTTINVIDRNASNGLKNKDLSSGSMGLGADINKRIQQ